jgi:phosphoribosylformylglycinamidine synthase
VLGIVGIIDDVTHAVPAHFQRAEDAILLLWPVPRGEEPNPSLEVPFKPAAISPYIVYPLSLDAPFPVASPLAEPVAESDEDSVDSSSTLLTAYGSSEHAKAVLGGVWGQPPSLDLEAEADLHTLLAALAQRRLVHSACDVADGGIAVALAQAAFTKGIGVKVEQEPSLMAHPLFGLFAEPASTVLLTTEPSQVAQIEKLAGEYSFFVARIGTTGGDRLEISVYSDPLISAPLDELRKPWASALESALHDEVTA